MLNKLQNEALNLAITGHNLFLNGPSGTGKTHCIKEIAKKLTETGKTVAITCTTGIACSNFSCATTLHRWSGIHDGRFSSDDIINLILSNESAVERVRGTDVLIIDEISMLSRKLFDQLVSLLAHVRDKTKFLGGIQLIVCGDFYQLPPVPNRRYNDNGEFCFYSNHFQKLHRLTLLEVVRQKDQEFVDIIHKVALGGEIDTETAKYIKALDRPLKNPEKSTKLYATNDLVNSFNRSKIEHHPGNIVEYISQDIGQNKYLKEFTVPRKLWLKEKCPVVLIRNLSEKLVNGLQGFVTGFSEEGPYVHFPALNITTVIGKVQFSGIIIQLCLFLNVVTFFKGWLHYKIYCI